MSQTRNVDCRKFSIMRGCWTAVLGIVGAAIVSLSSPAVAATPCEDDFLAFMRERAADGQAPLDHDAARRRWRAMLAQLAEYDRAGAERKLSRNLAGMKQDDPNGRGVPFMTCALAHLDALYRLGGLARQERVLGGLEEILKDYYASQQAFPATDDPWREIGFARAPDGFNVKGKSGDISLAETPLVSVPVLDRQTGSVTRWKRSCPSADAQFQEYLNCR